MGGIIKLKNLYTIVINVKGGNMPKNYNEGIKISTSNTITGRIKHKEIKNSYNKNKPYGINPGDILIISKSGINKYKNSNFSPILSLVISTGISTTHLCNILVENRFIEIEKMKDQSIQITNSKKDKVILNDKDKLIVDSKIAKKLFIKLSMVNVSQINCGNIELSSIIRSYSLHVVHEYFGPTNMKIMDILKWPKSAMQKWLYTLSRGDKIINRLIEEIDYNNVGTSKSIAGIQLIVGTKKRIEKDKEIQRLEDKKLRISSKTSVSPKKGMAFVSKINGIPHLELSATGVIKNEVMGTTVYSISLDVIKKAPILDALASNPFILIYIDSGKFIFERDNREGTTGEEVKLSIYTHEGPINIVVKNYSNKLVHGFYLKYGMNINENTPRTQLENVVHGVDIHETSKSIVGSYATLYMNRFDQGERFDEF